MFTSQYLIIYWCGFFSTLGWCSWASRYFSVSRWRGWTPLIASAFQSGAVGPPLHQHFRAVQSGPQLQHFRVVQLAECTTFYPHVESSNLGHVISREKVFGKLRVQHCWPSTLDALCVLNLDIECCVGTVVLMADGYANIVSRDWQQCFLRNLHVRGKQDSCFTLYI